MVPVYLGDVAEVCVERSALYIVLDMQSVQCQNR